MTFRRLFTAIALFSTLLSGCAADKNPMTDNAVSAASAKGGMVATRSALASQVGADILAQGGNAIDAAVAVGFALAVTHPAAGNLGGGGFMIISLADGTTVANDHREMAPGRATKDMFLDIESQVVEGLSTRSHLSSGVPGSVAGLLDALTKYGTMSRAEVLEPAINLAKNGIVLDEDLARSFQRNSQEFANYPASAAIFSRDGQAYEVGDLWVQADLAAALERIKAEGKAGFYAGKTADLLVAEMQRGGGLISHADLRDYHSVWRQTIRSSYRSYDIVSMPPPSSGGILLVQMLNMLETFDIGGMGYGSVQSIHTLIEAERRAYADRATYLGDSDFYPVPISKLTDKAYALERFADFDPSEASTSQDTGAGQIPAESMETTHASIIDGQGNAVAYTTTLNLSYGNKIVVPGAGFLLNNEMDDFVLKENVANYYGLIGGEANSIQPGKRMLSSMSPTIVLKDDQPVLVTGSPGGSTIITTTLQVIVNVLDHGMSLADAVASPRFHHQWLPEEVLIEPGALTQQTWTELEDMGHNEIVLLEQDALLGDANSVMRTAQGFIGVADPRGGGAAVGVRASK